MQKLFVSIDCSLSLPSSCVSPPSVALLQRVARHVYHMRVIHVSCHRLNLITFTNFYSTARYMKCSEHHTHLRCSASACASSISSPRAYSPWGQPLEQGGGFSYRSFMISHPPLKFPPLKFHHCGNRHWSSCVRTDFFRLGMMGL